MGLYADGSVNKISFAGRGKIVAAFSRYTGADPFLLPVTAIRVFRA